MCVTWIFNLVLFCFQTDLVKTVKAGVSTVFDHDGRAAQKHLTEFETLTI